MLKDLAGYAGVLAMLCSALAVSGFIISTCLDESLTEDIRMGEFMIIFFGGLSVAFLIPFLFFSR
jgi:hypothetical protein